MVDDIPKLVTRFRALKHRSIGIATPVDRINTPGTELTGIIERVPNGCATGLN
jgi:type IV secretory pathway ATPase VirB11/archaellum biosynthesis ATPase